MTLKVDVYMSFQSMGNTLKKIGKPKPVRGILQRLLARTYLTFRSLKLHCTGRRASLPQVVLGGRHSC